MNKPQMSLLELYAKLPETERLALDETIMDEGIHDMASLIKVVELVDTYFKESVDV